MSWTGTSRPCNNGSMTRTPSSNPGSEPLLEDSVVKNSSWIGAPLAGSSSGASHCVIGRWEMQSENGFEARRKWNCLLVHHRRSEAVPKLHLWYSSGTLNPAVDIKSSSPNGQKRFNGNNGGRNGAASFSAHGNPGDGPGHPGIGGGLGRVTIWLATKMSVMPASLNTSASPTLVTLMPPTVLPACNCRWAILGVWCPVT